MCLHNLCSGEHTQSPFRITLFDATQVSNIGTLSQFVGASRDVNALMRDKSPTSWRTCTNVDEPPFIRWQIITFWAHTRSTKPLLFASMAASAVESKACHELAHFGGRSCNFEYRQLSHTLRDARVRIFAKHGVYQMSCPNTPPFCLLPFGKCPHYCKTCSHIGLSSFYPIIEIPS